MHTPSQPPFSIAAAIAAALRQLVPGSETPRLDAELLLGFTLEKPRTWLRAWPERLLTDEQAVRFFSQVEQRALGVPLAYLVGEKEFWSRRFVVGPGVLIPRPDTETLIEQALSLIAPDRPAAVLDLGTGSGIIAVTLAAERPLARVLAVDRSPAALEMARINVQQHQTFHVELRQSDWFSAITPTEVFDLVVSNPPYLREDDPHLRDDGIRYEPRAALIAGRSGLDDIAIISRNARRHLGSGGFLLLEHGYDQAAATGQWLERQGYLDIRHYPDLQGHCRVTRGRQP